MKEVKLQKGKDMGRVGKEGMNYKDSGMEQKDQVGIDQVEEGIGQEGIDLKEEEVVGIEMEEGDVGKGKHSGMVDSMVVEKHHCYPSMESLKISPFFFSSQ